MGSQAPRAEEYGHISFIFDVISLFIDFVPLILAMILASWRLVMKCFSPCPLLSGAILNVVLVYHVLFVIQTEKHKTTLFIGVVGFVLDCVYVFIIGVYRTAQGFLWTGFFWRIGSLLSLCVAGPWLIYLTDTGYHVPEEKSIAMYIITIVVVVLSNVCSMVEPLQAIWSGIFDRQVPQGIGMAMCIVTAVDNSYFIIYAVVLSQTDSLLMIVSIVNAVSAVILLVTLIIKKYKDYNIYEQHYQRNVVKGVIKFD